MCIVSRLQHFDTEMQETKTCARALSFDHNSLGGSLLCYSSTKTGWSKDGGPEGARGLSARIRQARRVG